MENASGAAIPDHVPQELVWTPRLDLYGRELADPYRAISRLHEGPDIVWSRMGVWGQPAWVLTRYDLVQEAFMDHVRFSAREGSNLEELLGVDWKLNPLSIDPPDHVRYRKILNPIFSPSAINRLDETARAVCRSLFATFEESGRCEFVSEMASVFPAHLFLALMGLPEEEAPQFLRWEAAFMHGDSPEMRATGARSILAYLQDAIRDRKACPRDDIISRIASSEVNGRPIDDDEAISMCYMLYLAGLDTVASAIGWSVRHLAQDVSLQERLREDPSLIPLAVEELLRAYGIIGVRRTATHDFEFHGVRFRRGDYVLLLTYLSGRDARRFDQPHKVDIHRKARHLAFGAGVHNCAGIHLARRELAIVIDEFLKRFRNPRIPEGDSVDFAISNATLVWGVARLPLMWDRPLPGAM